MRRVQLDGPSEIKNTRPPDKRDVVIVDHVGLCRGQDFSNSRRLQHRVTELVGENRRQGAESALQPVDFHVCVTGKNVIWS